MYYELYVDVLFLVNFMMDYLLLMIVKKILRCTATHRNICLGAGMGAFLTCIVIVLPIPYVFVKIVLFHTLANTVMIKVGLKINNISKFIRAVLVLYAGGFLLGGVLEYLHQYVKTGSLFFALAVAGYYAVLGIWNFLSYLQRISQYKCKVDLYMGEKEYRVEGLIDTGNGLCEPITGKPVSILDRKAAVKFFESVEIQGIRYIPYHSIGKKEGVLAAVVIDKMCVHRKEACWICRPLIAVSEEEISVGGEYEMILNPDLF